MQEHESEGVHYDGFANGQHIVHLDNPTVQKKDTPVRDPDVLHLLPATIDPSRVALVGSASLDRRVSPMPVGGSDRFVPTIDMSTLP